MAGKKNKPQFTDKKKQQLQALNTLFTSAKSQKELAVRLGTTPRTIQRWLKGDTTPKADKLEKITKTYSAYAPTLKNEKKKENFTQKRATATQRKKVTEKEKAKHKPPVPTEQILPIAQWWKKYMEKDYKNLPEYDTLLDTIYSRGLQLARFMSNNPTEAMLLKSLNEDWDNEPFIQMVGITEGYPYDERSRKLFMRRAVRVKYLVHKGLSLEEINNRLRNLFFSGKDGVNTDIKQFNAYFIDHINPLQK